MKRDGAPGLVLVRLEEPPPQRCADLVWRHALDATDPLDQHDLLAVVLDLLRTAHHDVATMTSALTIGRTRVRTHPTDLVARRSAGFVEQALVFMGGEPVAVDRCAGPSRWRRP